MIFGIGTDIQKVARIREALTRHGDRFAERILGPDELVIYRRRSGRAAHRGVLFVATRFAAKEAISKALGLGMRMPMRWRAAQILKERSGKPCVATDATLSAWMAERSLVAHVTLTDDDDYAVAFAVVERVRIVNVDDRTLGPVMLDVVGLALTDDDRRRLAHPNTGGMILFARNFASRAQVAALVSEIRAVRADLLIAVDHEGGRVQRFRTDGFVHLPSMRALGALWDADIARGPLRATRAATATGFVLAADLVACGIDLSFTPVLDLDHGPSTVIGDRAFHRDPRIVAMLAKSLMHGLALAGMANCGKHFPGHGHVAADSHVAIPVDDRDLDTILDDDALPYGWLEGTLSSVMPAHVIYPQVDDRPAGFSPIWLRDILRGRLGFDGAIFSDDLSMEGASVAGDVVTAGGAALAAGCDMVLVCNDVVRADALLAGLVDRRDPSSAERLARLRARVGDHRQDSRYARSLACLRESGLIAA